MSEPERSYGLSPSAKFAATSPSDRTRRFGRGEARCSTLAPCLLPRASARTSTSRCIRLYGESTQRAISGFKHGSEASRTRTGWLGPCSVTRVAPGHAGVLFPIHNALASWTRTVRRTDASSELNNCQRKIFGVYRTNALERRRAGNPYRQPDLFVQATPKGRINQHEKRWLDLPWHKVRDSVEVKLHDHEGELYVLAKSARCHRCDRLRPTRD
jgi:hypothetical protein